MNDGALAGCVIFDNAVVQRNVRVPRRNEASHGQILAELTIGLFRDAANTLLEAKSNAQHAANLHGGKRRSNAVTSGVGDQ